MIRVSATYIISTRDLTTASGACHIFCAATSLQRDQAWPRRREVAAQYRRLQLQFRVLLTMCVVHTRNMCSELAE